jgi:hypothetical protein
MAAQGQLGEAEELRLKKQVIRCAFAHVANEAAIDREVRQPSTAPVCPGHRTVGRRVCSSKASLLCSAFCGRAQLVDRVLMFRCCVRTVGCGHFGLRGSVSADGRCNRPLGHR